jgi:hypothetical protein
MPEVVDVIKKRSVHPKEIPSYSYIDVTDEHNWVLQDGSLDRGSLRPRAPPHREQVLRRGHGHGAL